MTIDKIDDKRLLISLTDEDMQAFDLRFSQFLWSDNHSRLVIKNLLALASEETGFCIDNKRLMIEVIPKLDGCMVFFTTLKNSVKRSRKKFKIKTDIEPLVYSFNTSEDLLQAVEKIISDKKGIFNSRIFRYRNKYFLVLYTQTILHLSTSIILNEYGKLYAQGNIAVSKINEYGSTIINDHAIEKIVKYFS